MMPWLWPSAKLKVGKPTVETTGDISLLSISGKILARSHPELANHHVRSQSTRSPVWISAQGAAWLTWFSQCETGPREMHRAEPGFVLCIDWPDQGFWNSQQREPTCLYWHSTNAPQKFIQIIRLFHVGMTEQVLSNDNQSQSFRDLQWGEARLCPGTSPFQLVLHLCFQLHCTGYWWGSVYPLLSLMVLYFNLCWHHSQVKDSDWSHPGCTASQWLCTHGTQVQWLANHAEQVLRCLKAIWPHH